MGKGKAIIASEQKKTVDRIKKPQGDRIHFATLDEEEGERKYIEVYRIGTNEKELKKELVQLYNDLKKKWLPDAAKKDKKRKVGEQVFSESMLASSANEKTIATAVADFVYFKEKIKVLTEKLNMGLDIGSYDLLGPIYYLSQRPKLTNWPPVFRNTYKVNFLDSLFEWQSITFSRLKDCRVPPEKKFSDYQYYKTYVYDGTLSNLARFHKLNAVLCYGRDFLHLQEPRPDLKNPLKLLQDYCLYNWSFEITFLQYFAMAFNMKESRSVSAESLKSDDYVFTVDETDTAKGFYYKPVTLHKVIRVHDKGGNDAKVGLLSMGDVTPRKFYLNWVKPTMQSTQNVYLKTTQQNKVLYVPFLQAG